MNRYSNSFEPLLLEGQTATLYGTDCPEGGLNVECIAVGAMPEYYKDFGALAATQWDLDQEDTNLEMNPLELGQFRMRILDAMKCRLKNPSSVEQWRTMRTNFELPQFPRDDDDFLKCFMWKASEFFVFEKNTPRFDLYSTFAQTTSGILFSGWRFKLREISKPGVIKMWWDSWPSGGTSAIRK